MRKLLIICLLLCLVSIAYGVPRSSDRDERGSFTGPRAGTGRDDNIMALLNLMHDQLYGSSGNIFYCDSGETTGTEDGKSWETATDTLDEAINLCTANAGDVIYIAPGHAETITTVSAIAMDVAGVTVRGFGRGSLMPTLTLTGGAIVSQITGPYISAANCCISGIKIYVTSGVQDLMVCDASSDGFEIADCVFEVASGFMPPTFIDIFEHADDGYILRNKLVAGADVDDVVCSGISFSTVSGITIKDYKMIGKVHAWLYNSKEADDVWVEDNVLYGGTMTGDNTIGDREVIKFADETSGLFLNNTFVSTANAKSMRVADDCTFVGNQIGISDGDEFEGLHAGMFGDNPNTDDYVASGVAD